MDRVESIAPAASAIQTDRRRCLFDGADKTRL